MTEQTSSKIRLTCDGSALKQMTHAGLAWLERNHEAVNQLNVFPVPDGDTGTNMLLTMRSAYREIATNESTDVGVIADKLAYGAIMGSRGNSGTILSQLLRGFSQSISGKHEFDAATLATGMRQAVRMAYKAVQTPVEGTILTVGREVAEEIETLVNSTNDLTAILEGAVARAKSAVARTPEQLPILKKAGVVDSGGQGLTYILEGMLLHLNGELPTIETSFVASTKAALADVLRSEDERGYGYDVQYIVRSQNLDIDQIRKDIAAMGDSMVVVGDSTLAKVHIHVHDPGIPISYGVKLGIVSDVVVENMQEQSEEYIAMRSDEDENAESIANMVEGEIGVVAVAPGEGLSRVFRDLGATYIVSGGQTMNPSTEELLQAAQALPTDKVLILPNNKNIILAAEQAAALASEKSDLKVVVVPTRTVPQGITAMLSFTGDGDFDNIIATMQNARDNVVTGEVTTAIRSVEIDNVQVETGQVIGLVDGKLAVSGDELEDVVRRVLDKMLERAPEVITMYYGDHVSKNEAEQLVSKLRDDYSDQEFDLIYGGQPHYHYIMSAE